MKAMMTGFALMVVISVGAYFVLNGLGFTTEEAQSNSNVRLD